MVDYEDVSSSIETFVSIILGGFTNSSELKNAACFAIRLAATIKLYSHLGALFRVLRQPIATILF